ncbi:MAG: hypothetical protein NZ988_05305 [Thaumarchaeota archaeon]|nr:hypothetical protein [Candidatus Calditenuaceae archaeon]MDW8187443.1 hypothetical protein [Nitrososphaerota archaeon]
MTRSVSRTVFLAAVVVVAFALGVSGYFLGYNTGRDEVLEEFRQLRSLNERLSSEIESLNAQLSKLRLERDDLMVRVNSLQTNLATISNSVSELQNRLRAAEAGSTEINKRVERARSIISSLEKAVPIYTQIFGRDNLLQLLFVGITDIRQINETQVRIFLTNYWSGLKSTVAEYDPQLTPSVDRIINNIGGVIDYIRWLQRQPPAGASLEQILRWSLEYPSSFDAYQESVLRFVDEFMLSVSSKIIALRDTGL